MSSKTFVKRLQREKEAIIIRIKSDHRKEFETAKFSNFCSSEELAMSSHLPSMSFGRGENQMLNISMCLGVNVISWLIENKDER